MGRPRKNPLAATQVQLPVIENKRATNLNTVTLEKGRPPKEKTVVSSITKEEKVRRDSGKPTTVERATSLEKDDAPILIVQYVDGAGHKKSKVFSCSSIRLSEYKDQTLTKAGPKTTLNISVEASVVEVS